MSGLYTAVFGESPNAETLLTWLGFRRRDIPRWRDTYKTEQAEIAVYARLGGGNRADYQPVIDQVRRHPLFKRDEDDSFDRTYLTFFFVCPAIHAYDFAEMESEKDRNSLWAEKIEAMQHMSDAEMAELTKRVEQEVVVLTPGDSPGTVSLRDLLGGLGGAL